MGNAQKLLIVDDDLVLRGALAEQFGLHPEFSTVSAGTAAEGLAILSQTHVDLVLLDLGLPDMDGRELCRQMRGRGFSGPILILTGRDGENDVIQGLESGANDYVLKPFRFAVLLARIRAQLRQHAHSDNAVFRIGPYAFHPGGKFLQADGNRKIRLTEKETAILKFLLNAGDAVVARDVLLHEVWGYQAGVTTHTLETHIYRLRQKIEREPSQAEILVTEAGGYKLVP